MEDNQNGSDYGKKCPVCGTMMQMSGQKADSNSVIKQKYLCTSCKKAGRSPSNFFVPERKLGTNC